MKNRIIFILPRNRYRTFGNKDIVRKNVDIRDKEQFDSIRKVTFLTCLSAHSRVDYLIPFSCLRELVVQSR